MHETKYQSTYDRCWYTFWSMSGAEYNSRYDKNFTCDSDSRVYVGMNNRFAISADELDPDNWGFQLTIYDPSDSYVLGYVADSGYVSPVSAIEAAILAHENYLRGDTSLFCAA